MTTGIVAPVTTGTVAPPVTTSFVTSGDITTSQPVSITTDVVSTGVITPVTSGEVEITTVEATTGVAEGIQGTDSTR